MSYLGSSSLWLVVAWLVAHLYVAHRFAQPLASRGRRVTYGIFTASAVVMPAMVVVRQLDHLESLHVVASWIGYLGIGLFTLLFVFSVLRDLGWLGFRGVEWAATSGDDPDDKLVDPERRKIMKIGLNGGVVAAATAATRKGVSQARGVPDVVEVDVPVDNLPRQLEGYRIVQLSDLHIGQTIRRPTVRKIVHRVELLGADLVALTGDVAEGYVRHIRRDVEPLFQLQAPDGVHYVTGNHEYYWNAPRWCEVFADRGFTVHNNDHAVVRRGGARLVVAGCTDYDAGSHIDDHASDPEGAMKGAPDHDASILLAHRPLSVEDAARAGYDLQLSGHTHGGQYWPWIYIAGAYHRFPAGLGKQGDTRIYVSRGTGYWGPPLRLGSPPEITVLTLRDGAHPARERRLDDGQFRARYGTASS